MAKATTGKTTRKRSTAAKSVTTKTRTRSTASRKTSASLRDAAEPSPTEATAAVVTPDAEDAANADEANVLRKKELIEAVVQRAGVKKRDAKPAVEAALAILGETLAQGQGINVPELGKLKIQNSKSVGDVQVLNLRMRRKLSGADSAAEESEKEGLAEPAE